MAETKRDREGERERERGRQRETIKNGGRESRRCGEAVGCCRNNRRIADRPIQYRRNVNARIINGNKR